MSADRSLPLLVHPAAAYALADGLGRAVEPLAHVGAAGIAVQDPAVGPAVARALDVAAAVAAAVLLEWRRAADAMTMAIAATHAADLGVAPAPSADAATSGIER